MILKFLSFPFSVMAMMVVMVSKTAAALVGVLLRWCSDHGCCYAADLVGS
jgi:hypothetical protein